MVKSEGGAVGGSLFAPDEVLSPEELFDLTDADYVEYVDLHLGDPLDAPVWEALIGVRMVKRTRQALGTLVQRAVRRAERQKAVMPWPQYRTWQAEEHVPVRELLHGLLAVTRERSRQYHQEHQLSQRRAGPGVETTMFVNATNRHLLEKLVMAIYWHRRECTEAGREPSESDLKLWRQIERGLTLAEDSGREVTLSQLWGSGRYGPTGVGSVPRDWKPKEQP